MFNFSNNSDIENRKWYEPMRIVGVVTTTAIAMFAILFFILNVEYYSNPNHRKYVYSFERDFNSLSGQIFKCSFNPNEKGTTTTICGGIEDTESFKFFLEKYGLVLKENFLLKKHCNISKDTTAFWRSYEEEKCIKSNQSNIDYKLLNSKIEEGVFNNIESKKIVHIDNLILYAVIHVFLPVIWFFLWQIVIYKLIPIVKIKTVTDRNKVILSIISATTLFVAAFVSDLPYGYFTFMRFLVCAVCIYLATLVYNRNRESLLIWLFGLIAVLFNPLIPVTFEREWWIWIDIVVGVFLFFSIFFFKLPKKKE